MAFFCKRVPCFLVAIDADRLIDDIEHIICVVVVEGKSVPSRAVRLNAVAQAARLAHDGDRAVTGCDHLRKAARFALGRHQEEIRARIDLARKIGVEGNNGHDLPLISARKIAEIVFICRVACPKQDKLNVLAQDLLNDFPHEIKPLVRNKAGDHGNDGRVGFHGQIEHPLQLFLADSPCWRHPPRRSSQRATYPSWDCSSRRRCR